MRLNRTKGITKSGAIVIVLFLAAALVVVCYHISALRIPMDADSHSDWFQTLLCTILDSERSFGGNFRDYLLCGFIIKNAYRTAVHTLIRKLVS